MQKNNNQIITSRYSNKLALTPKCCMLSNSLTRLKIVRSLNYIKRSAKSPLFSNINIMGAI